MNESVSLCQVSGGAPSQLSEQLVPRIQEISPELSWSEESIRSHLSGAATVNLFGVRRGRLVAAALFEVLPPESSLHWIAVEPGRRSQGIGKHLMQHSFQLLASQGISRLYCEVRSRNYGARQFYLRLGFRMVGRRKGYYQDDDGVLMECILFPAVSRGDVVPALHSSDLVPE